MPRTIPLPDSLSGRSLRVSDPLLSALGPDRLRGPDVGRPHWGIRSFDDGDASVPARARRLLPALAPNQAFSHLTAAELLGVPLPGVRTPSDALHVITIGRDSQLRRPGVVGHRARALPVTRVLGLPVVAPDQLWQQLSALGPRRGFSPEWVVAVGDHLISGSRDGHGRRPLTSLAQLSRLVHDGPPGRRGLAALRWALPLLRRPVDSPMESLLRLGLVAAGLPEPRVNQPVLLRDGRIRQVDLGWEEPRLAVEYEGDEHRTDRRRWQSDIVRVLEIEDAGWKVLRATAQTLRRPAALVAMIRRHLIERAGSGPRPPLSARNVHARRQAWGVGVTS